MPPSRVFSRDAVLQGAFRLAREKGRRALTARQVAGRLRCSTTPIYEHFGTIDNLRLEVAGLAREVLLEYTRRPYTEHPFLNMGIGVVTFAKEQTELYRMLFMESSEFRGVNEELLAVLVRDMEHDIRFKDMDLARRGRLLEKMSTFTYGLASTICLGLARESSDAYIHKILKEVGSVVIAAALEESAKSKGNKGCAGEWRPVEW
ncbi:MAG: hypothetical protein A3F83_07595 [Candidatus Glassbacteria bacterium RIFCSPLOWO2_12_FULL_58_11]|uniref:HTH tetR-type domain-containing protein n=1 Tax=Candidatus Glassbacteria bacterium RIFCSPLOWO2_12_FULL_58_11 TaxID=1817867 RepID=A0A1F5Z3E9_9BACT|nr:MAG: hypothetical protein A3F83_07595 [Candidatus Glassbacteria bacterium RIFCSPLOWO2_12_FULL_58_11]